SDLSVFPGISVACLVEYSVGTERTSPENSSKICGAFSARTKKRTAGCKKTRSARSVLEWSMSEGERGISGEGIGEGIPRPYTPIVFRYSERSLDPPRSHPQRRAGMANERRRFGRCGARNSEYYKASETYWIDLR